MIANTVIFGLFLFAFVAVIAVAFGFRRHASTVLFGGIMAFANAAMLLKQLRKMNLKFPDGISPTEGSIEHFASGAVAVFSQFGVFVSLILSFIVITSIASWRLMKRA